MSIYLELVNDMSGNDREGNYRYSIYFGERLLKKGKLKGHSRREGYRKLLALFGRELLNEYTK